MATLIPARGICRPRMTVGGRRFNDRAEDTLEDNLVWVDVLVGPRPRRPDFTVLHPSRGMQVLEVSQCGAHSSA